MLHTIYTRCARVTEMYVLEMVHGAVRRLYMIWNCALECSYYYYYLSAKWGGIPLKCGTPGFDSHLYCGLFPGPVTPVTETCALHCALFPGPVTPVIVSLKHVHFTVHCFLVQSHQSLKHVHFTVHCFLVQSHQSLKHVHSSTAYPTTGLAL